MNKYTYSARVVFDDHDIFNRHFSLVATSKSVQFYNLYINNAQYQIGRKCCKLELSLLFQHLVNRMREEDFRNWMRQKEKEAIGRRMNRTSTTEADHRKVR